MKKLILSLGIIAVTSLAVFLPATAQNAEEAAVRAAIEHYFGATQQAGRTSSQGFHPESKCCFIRDGKFTAHQRG